jgi:16S rRNA (cytosine967-C5)-methyltransferase
MIKRNFRDHHLIGLLKEFSNQEGPLDLFINRYFQSHKALGSKDRGYIGEMVYQAVRWKGLIDAHLGEGSSWEEKIDLMQSRSIEELQAKDNLPLHAKVSFPAWLFEKICSKWGQKNAAVICQDSNLQAPACIRINPLMTTRDCFLEKLKNTFDVVRAPVSPQGIIFQKRINYYEIPEFRKGYFEIQDEGSQLLADLMDPRPQDQVIDFCSGSGGKTLAFAHKMKGKGQIYLHDIRPRILLEAKKRLRKAGIQNAQFLNSTSPHLKNLKGKMEWVLVDAPCSGTGTLRRNPDMKWKQDETTIVRLVNEQRRIFDEALKYLAPGGRIIWGTCSILPDENEDQVAHFLTTYPLELVQEPLQLLPKPGSHDGFYGAVLCFK